ncbi:MAG: hypothetical protein R3F59_11710 [Myxococcota bacterium]
MLRGASATPRAARWSRLAERSLLVRRADGLEVPQALREPLLRRFAAHPGAAAAHRRYAEHVIARTDAVDVTAVEHFASLLATGAATPAIVIRGFAVFESAAAYARFEALLDGARPADEDTRIVIGAVRADCWAYARRLDDARDLLAETLRRARRRGSPEMLFHTLLAQAWHERRSGRSDRMGPWLDEAEQIARLAGEDVGIAAVLQYRLIAAIDAGDVAQAPLVDEAVRVYRAVGEPRMAALMALRRPVFRMLAGDLDGAAAELATLLPPVGEAGGYDARVRLAEMRLAQGDLATARDHAVTAYVSTRRQGGKGRHPRFLLDVLDLVEDVPGARDAFAARDEPPTVEGTVRTALTALVRGDTATLSRGDTAELRCAAALHPVTPRAVPDALRALIRCRAAR